ncbi:hypothetical protein EGR_09796 [Echinococcus granulosus]|uniref:Uncharacterized protein n=1 Tax=Echinococcus granulosus TaxID=6210 RepID=W6UPN2_ECHGR|nr:hypothetical protein EGR_09796 [Echinococcus granulosus]EUB55359.1 hypothetical protein EGR_09796 [Echinococcus granulosus]
MNLPSNDCPGICKVFTWDEKTCDVCFDCICRIEGQDSAERTPVIYESAVENLGLDEILGSKMFCQVLIMAKVMRTCEVYILYLRLIPYQNFTFAKEGTALKECPKGKPFHEFLPAGSLKLICIISCMIPDLSSNIALLAIFVFIIMITSNLLTPDENCRVERLVSPGVIIKVAYIARLYMIANQRWFKVSSGVVTLEESPNLCVMEICFYDWDRIYSQIEEAKVDVRFEMSNLQRIKHIGISPNGKEFEVTGLNKEVDAKLLKALGVERCKAAELTRATPIHQRTRHREFNRKSIDLNAEKS